MVCINITKRLPVFGLSLISDLLGNDGVNVNWEAAMAGVTALLFLLEEIPLRIAGENDPVPLPANYQVRPCTAAHIRLTRGQT